MKIAFYETAASGRAVPGETAAGRKRVLSRPRAARRRAGCAARASCPNDRRPGAISSPRAPQMKPVMATLCVVSEQSKLTVISSASEVRADSGGGGGTAPVGLYHVVTFVCTL